MKRKKLIIVISISLILICGLGILVYYRSDDTKSLIVPTIWQLNTDRKVIALTFDDGPSQEKTAALLDLLKTEQVPATFFVSGQNVEKQPDLIKRMQAEGHLIGNHSFAHKRLIFQLPQTVQEEVDKTDIALNKLGVPVNKYFRPPYSDEMLILPLVLNERGKVIISYSIDPLAQYNEVFDPKAVSSFVVQTAHPGAIVVLHDGTDKDIPEFISGMKEIISELKQQGYTFVTVAESQG